MLARLLALLAIPGAFSVFGFWLWHVNRRINIVPCAALAPSPHRWTEEIRKAAAEVGAKWALLEAQSLRNLLLVLFEG